MVMVSIIILIQAGDFLPALVMDGFPCLSTLILRIGGHAVIAMVTVTDIIMDITVVTTTVIGLVMPEDAMTREMYTKVARQFAHQTVATVFQHSL